MSSGNGEPKKGLAQDLAVHLRELGDDPRRSELEPWLQQMVDGQEALDREQPEIPESESDRALLVAENEHKKKQLENALGRLSHAVIIVHDADVDLDFADALRAEADRLERQYSTVKYRFVGIPGGEPGRVNKRLEQ